MLNAKPVNALPLSDFDPRTFERLPKGSTAHLAAKALPLCVMAVAYLTDYCASDPRPSGKFVSNELPDHAFALSFPLGAEGAQWVEQYLAEVVRPGVVKWNSRHQPISVRPGEEPTHRLYIAGLLWGQCLAQEFNMRWVENPRDAHRPLLASATDVDPMPGIDPWIKVCKYAHLGEEDSLVSFIAAMRNRSENDRLMKDIDVWMRSNLDRVLLGNVHRRQYWHGPDGQLQDVVLIDRKGATLLRVAVREVLGLPTI